MHRSKNTASLDVHVSLGHGMGHCQHIRQAKEGPEPVAAIRRNFHLAIMNQTVFLRGSLFASQKVTIWQVIVTLNL